MKKEKLKIKDIEFEQVLRRNVIKNNKTSGKIQVPPKFIGRVVYIVIP